MTEFESTSTIFPVTSWDVGQYAPFDLVVFRMRYVADAAENSTSTHNFALSISQANELITDLQNQIALLQGVQSGSSDTN